MARSFIILVALVYAGLGIGFLLAPAAMSSGIDLAPKTAKALTDVRATYGGFELGVAALLLLFATRKRWIVSGLLTVLLTVAGFALGRSFGMVVDGVDGVLHPAFLLLELSVVGAATWLLRREHRRGKQDEPSRQVQPAKATVPS